jgi:peroxiredoxin
VDTSLATASAVKQTSQRKTTRIVAAFALLALLCIPEFLVIFVQRSANQATLHRGDTIPPLMLRDLNSHKFSLPDFTGKRLALLFFKVDCPHCQRELLTVNRLSTAFKDDIVFAAISLSDAQKTKDLVDINKSGMLILVDEKAEARNAFGVLEVPALFLVNGDQAIEYRGVGEQSPQKLRKLFATFAQNKNPSGPDDSGD